MSVMSFKRTLQLHFSVEPTHFSFSASESGWHRSLRPSRDHILFVTNLVYCADQRAKQHVTWNKSCNECTIQEMTSWRISGAAQRIMRQGIRPLSTGGENNVNILSGIPNKHAARCVRIFRPTKYVEGLPSDLSISRGFLRSLAHRRFDLILWLLTASVRCILFISYSCKELRRSRGVEAWRKCGEWCLRNLNRVIDGPIHLWYVKLPNFSHDSLRYLLHYASNDSMNNVTDSFFNSAFQWC